LASVGFIYGPVNAPGRSVDRHAAVDYRMQ